MASLNIIQCDLCPTQGDRDNIHTIDVCPACRARLTHVPGSLAEVQTIAQVEERHILSVMTLLGWNKSQAAHALGIERSTLDRKLKRYDAEKRQRCPIHFAPENTDVPNSNAFCTCQANSIDGTTVAGTDDASLNPTSSAPSQYAARQ